MIEFHSASARIVNSRRAIADCLEAAVGENVENLDLVVIHASLGHDFQTLAEEASLLCPNAQVLGASCCGVVGREGVSESMKDIAIMCMSGGDELAVVHADRIYGDNSYEKSRQMAEDLKRRLPNTNMVYFMASGIDIDNQACIQGIESVFGEGVTIFGATSSDNMRGIISYQIFGSGVFTHSAWMIGFADPTLSVETQASHGFVAVGEPMTVTRAMGNRIIELNGEPAWEEYTRRLGLSGTANCDQTIPIGALAEALPTDLAEEYGNPHILRVVTKRDKDGTMYYATGIKEGTELFLTVRDENLIFSDMDRMISALRDRIGERQIVGVFHADCLARGRHMFHQILKEELVSRMQIPLQRNGNIAPWLGMYGFGEYARLGGKNTYHNYTSAIYAICRNK
jgi:hypothetical protein